MAEVNSGQNEKSRRGSGGGELEAYFDDCYKELRQRARQMFRGERVNHTLQATAVVNEAYLRLANSGSSKFQDRVHFIGSAGKVMRNLLVDHAKMRNAKKRGGEDPSTQLPILWRLVQSQSEPELYEVLDLNDALDELKKVNEKYASIVELHSFAGATIAETAELLGMSKSAVADCRPVAFAWMRRRLAG